MTEGELDQICDHYKINDEFVNYRRLIKELSELEMDKENMQSLF